MESAPQQASRTLAIIDEIYATGIVVGPNGNKREAFPASLPREDGEGLNQLVRRVQPRRSLEIGMAFGLSTLFICDGLPNDAQHTAIDPFQEKWFDSIGPYLIAQAGHAHRFRVFIRPSYLVLPELLEGGEEFEFIFIDGNHRFDYTLVDFFLADKALAVGGHVVLHDPWLPAVSKAIKYITENRADAFRLARQLMHRTSPPQQPSRTMTDRLKRRFTKSDPTAPGQLSGDDYNFFVFEKTAHQDDEEMAKRWDHFQPF